MVETATLDSAEIIAANKKRLSERKYDPLTGTGSVVKRIRLVLDATDYVLLPAAMLSIAMISEIKKQRSSLKAYAVQHNLSFDTLLNSIIRLRFEYDFEYWCAVCVKIQDKETKQTIPLILRPAQRKLAKILLTELEADRPIRIILLKARQWGGSTVIQVFMAWIQLFRKKGWHSAIVADLEDQARNIRAMYSRIAKHHPKEVFGFEFGNFENSSKNKIIENRECVVYIASMQNPDSLRSSDIMMAHLSEVGLWKETEGKKPEDVLQSIAGTIPSIPGSLIAMESTAKGVGNFFHKQWQNAVNQQNGFIPVFVPWYEIEMYRKPFGSKKELETFAASLSEKERYYFSLGASLENIHWYRTKKFTDGYDDWRMGCEFPTTPSEAFQSTGRRAHSPAYIERMRKYCLPAKYTGELMADTAYGKEAIGESLRFEPVANGRLLLWALPDKTVSVKRRYVVSMDIGGRHDKADWSVISIIDRYWLLQEGVEECIGTYRFHMDQDLAVWKAVQVATFFNNALLVVEANSLDNKGSEGDHTLTILDEIKGYYDNLFSRTDPQKILEGYPERYGFFTSQASKTDLVNQMNRRFRETGYIERDARVLDEADTYEIKENGSYGAVDGAHDDLYMSRAIGLKASQLEELPKQINPPQSV